jgi:tetratricopeptide (TPR) repeat protein
MAEFEAILMAARNLLDDAEKHLRAGDYDSARAAVEQALDVARKQDHTPSLAAAYYGMASVIWNSGGTSEDAHHYASLAAQHCKANTSTDLMVRTLIARLKAARGNYEAAVLLNEDLMRYYRREERLDGLADVMRSLGDISRAQGKYEVAKLQYFESLELYKKLEDPLNHSALLLSLGSLMFQMDHHDEAREFWEEARGIAQGQGFRHVLERVEEGLALFGEL